MHENSFAKFNKGGKDAVHLVLGEGVECNGVRGEAIEENR